MASQTAFVGTGADDASVGTNAWSVTGNIVADDNVRATTDNLNNSEVTHYLKGTNCGFTIPAGATIDGIVFELRKYAVSGATKDAHVRLVKADGSIGTTNKADTTTTWPAAAPGSIISYGSASDLWGESWTPADINDADFGAVVSATNASATNSSVRVDFFRLTVHYTEGGGTVDLSATSGGSSASGGTLSLTLGLSATSTGSATTAGQVGLAVALTAVSGGASASGGQLTVTSGGPAVERWLPSSEGRWGPDTDSRWPVTGEGRW